MSQKSKPASSSRKNKKHVKSFRFGAPLDELPCTYLRDCGNVAAFLVETGEIIRRHVDIEGLFRKSADLRRHGELKLKAERGEDLGDLDVHEVTCLVKTFLRLLPEPLLPCLFHNPFLSSMDLPADQRKDAVQSLCFALPAAHLSCLRYFMNLLAFITNHVDKNRMNARNLAVVLTPSLIRLKARTKLMSPEELRVLPKQTALVEHLISQARVIGCMTSQLRHLSVRMAKELLRKKLSAKKIKKGKPKVNLKERLGAALAALDVVASLHFRPTTCTTVSDTLLVDGPHEQAIIAGSMPRMPYTNCRTDIASHSISKKRKECSKERLSCQKSRRRSKKRRPKNVRCAMAPTECSRSKVMILPLIQSWSSAIPVMSNCSFQDGSDNMSCSSEDSTWSDEDSYHSDTNEESEIQPEVVKRSVLHSAKDDVLLVKKLNSSSERKSLDSSPKVKSISPDYICHKATEGEKLLSQDQTCTINTQGILIKEQKTWRPIKSHQLARLTRRCVSFESIYEPRQRNIKKCPSADNFSDKGNLTDPRKEGIRLTYASSHTSPNTPQHKIKCMTSSKTSPSRLIELFESKSSGTIVANFNQLLFSKRGHSKENTNQFESSTKLDKESHQFSNDLRELEIQTQNGKFIEGKELKQHDIDESRMAKGNMVSVPCNSNTEDISKAAEDVSFSRLSSNANLETVDDQQISFASRLLSVCLQQHAILGYHTKTVVQTQPAGKLKRRLLHSSHRRPVIEEQGHQVSTQNCPVDQTSLSGNMTSDSEDNACLLKTRKDSDPLELMNSLSSHRENTQSEDSFQHSPSHQQATSPCRQSGLTCGIETPSCHQSNSHRLLSPSTVSPHRKHRHTCAVEKPTCSQFQYLQGDPNVGFDQKRFSCGMESSPCHLFHHLKNERSVNLKNKQEGFASKVQTLPVNHVNSFQNNFPISESNQSHTVCEGVSLPSHHRSNDVPESEILQQWHLCEMARSQDNRCLRLQDESTEEYNYCKEIERRENNNLHHLQYDSNEECSCCRRFSNSLEHMPYHFKQHQTQMVCESRNQQRFCHHQSEHCANTNQSKWLYSMEEQQKRIDENLPYRNKIFPEYSSYHRSSYGFESIKPHKLQHYESSHISAYALFKERTNYTAGFSRAEEAYHRHFSKAIPEEVKVKDNRTCFLNSRHMPPQTYENSHERFFGQERHTQNDNVNYQGDYMTVWPAYEYSGIYKNMRENQQLSCSGIEAQEPSCQTMISDAWVKEQSRNEWEIHIDNKVEKQNIFRQGNSILLSTDPNQWDQQSCSSELQGIRRNAEDWGCDEFKDFHEIGMHVREHHDSFQEFRLKHREDIQMNDFAMHDSMRDYVHWNGYRSFLETSRAYSCTQNKHGQADYFVKHGNVSAESDLYGSSWNHKMPCNKEDTMNQEEIQSHFAGPSSSSRALQTIHFVPLTSGFITTTNHVSETSYPYIINNHQECTTLDFVESQPLHIHKHLQTARATDDRSMAEDSCHVNRQAVPPPYFNQHFGVKSRCNESQSQSQILVCGSSAPYVAVSSNIDAINAPETDKYCYHEEKDHMQQLKELKQRAVNDKGGNPVRQLDKGIYDTETVTLAKEDPYEKTAEKQTETKPHTSETEVNKNLEVHTMNQHHYGDGKVDTSGLLTDPSMEAASNSQRKHRRKSTGIINQIHNVNTTTATQEFAEKEAIESLQQHMETMSIEGKSQDQNSHKDPFNIICEKENATKKYCMMKTRQAFHQNYDDSSYREKTTASQILHCSTQVSESVATILDDSDLEHICRSNTNSSNTASNSLTFGSRTLQPATACLENVIEVVKSDSSILKLQSGILPPQSCLVTTPLQSSRPTSQNISDFSDIDSYRSGNQNCHPELARHSFDVTVDRRPKNKTVEKLNPHKRGHYLDLSSPSQTVPHNQFVVQIPSDLDCIYQAVGPTEKPLPRRAFFEPEGDIALKYF